mmetsp:Transcript_53250/g.113138  ORF Transcript_53250/g.113138 Transcript_53250/m.113138 type:complete len:251 (-) Transcript_53250:52-804(-)
MSGVGGDVGGEGDAPKEVELLSAWFCPYAQRAWIALEERCPGRFAVTESMKIRPPSTFEKSPMLLEKNPKALVPVILDRRGNAEAVVCESLTCVEYIDGAMGDGGPALLPGPPSLRVNARMWADRLNGEICSAFYSLLSRREGEGWEEAAEKFLGGLRAFSSHCKGPFFYGEDFTLVDIAVAPWAVGIRMVVLKHYRNFEVPRTREYAKYWEWAAAVSKRPSFVSTASKDLRAMIDVYLPYAEGTEYSSA